MGIIERIIVDDATLENLRVDALKSGRSLEQVAADRLRSSSFRPSRAEIIASLEAAAAMTPKDVAQTDSTLLIREDRDR